MNRRRYKQWLRDLFDHEESKGEWRFDNGAGPGRLPAEEIVEFITSAFECWGRDLAGYSDWQIAMGFEFIFSNSFSEYSLILRDGPGLLKKRLRAVGSLKIMFEECFNRRCLPVLGHLSEAGNALNSVCYMLWDTTPLSYCEGNPDREKIYTAIADVMTFCLGLSNFACIESGLHGLGHLRPYYPQVEPMIAKFLHQSPNLDPRLARYAAKTMSGCLL